MAFELPDLPYDYNALEPVIDEETMKLHHDKHHAAYVANLNKALEGHDDLLSMPIEELLKNINNVPEGKKQAVINNGGGHANHSFFWKIMKPNGGGVPTGAVKDAIEKEFGSFEEFKKQFSEKALTLFGSGWAFLVKTADGSLKLKRHSFQNSPILQGNIPILGLDVWEHAYYLKYQNRRAEYIENWWNVINWEEVEKNFA
jgi:superoxide dismutase, Fe-Mn family